MTRINIVNRTTGSTVGDMLTSMEVIKWLGRLPVTGAVSNRKGIVKRAIDYGRTVVLGTEFELEARQDHYNTPFEDVI
jgi:hypothetical protein